MAQFLKVGRRVCSPSAPEKPKHQLKKMAFYYQSQIFEVRMDRESSSLSDLFGLQLGYILDHLLAHSAQDQLARSTISEFPASISLGKKNKRYQVQTASPVSRTLCGDTAKSPA